MSKHLITINNNIITLTDIESKLNLAIHNEDIVINIVAKSLDETLLSNIKELQLLSNKLKDVIGMI